MEHRDGAEDPEASPDEAAIDPADDDYGPPFERRSFGGEFVWGQAPGYTAKVLRVRAGEVVAISTKGRRDMVVMLTGGRGLLETRADDNVDRIELMPATPIVVAEGEVAYRLVAMTDVEMFTIYTAKTSAT
jgi:voltage-gated potassium channel Kch